MAASRLYRVEGVVLKSAPLGEGDLLVTLLTRDGSKLRAMAWGARKLTSRKMGHLELLTRVDLALSKGRNLDTITQAHSLEAFNVMKSGLESTAKAFYLAEMVDGFAIEDGANPPLYSLFLDALRAVQDSPEDNATVPHFQLSLLQVTGFMPELYRCVECRQQILPSDHRFSVDLGGVLCSRCVPTGARIAPLSLQALKVLRHFHRSLEPNSSSLQVSDSLHQEL
ncbi:MAG: DNA repair protein RecO, partial [Dehalococcoidia bacterium]